MDRQNCQTIAVTLRLRFAARVIYNEHHWCQTFGAGSNNSSDYMFKLSHVAVSSSNHKNALIPITQYYVIPPVVQYHVHAHARPAKLVSADLVQSKAKKRSW